jgi:rod shape-determining protein MreD
MNSLRIAGGVGLVLLAAWLQVSLFGHLRPLGIIPNCMLLTVIVFGLWSDATPALAAAVGGGLLLDLASGSNFGLNMAFYVVVALAIIAGRQLGLHATSLVTGIAITIIGTLLYNLVILATIKASVSGVVAGRVGRELVVNLVLLALLYVIRANIGSRSRVTAELGIGRLP